jgi:hypothetical protein
MTTSKWFAKGVVMAKAEWGRLLPTTVADAINFDGDNPRWHYEGEASTSMASRQVEGVAYLWNLLSRHGVALLADEVGMGKTFQGLGVAAMLWKMKPDAKVLVMAPNRDICAHWRREYETFVERHVREVDHCVKNGADGGPVQAIHACWNLDELANAVESQAGHLYLTTIYSLSGLVPTSEKGSNNNAKARAAAGKIHQRIKQALGGQGFDLIIVDEAHYFRNRDGDSQRVHAAEAFFGSPEAPLAPKVLLMTATPSHTHLNDVGNILGYFRNMTDEPEQGALALMSQYGLRRFRRMKGKGDRYFSKREYRHEKGVASGFEGRPESELFFALYQKKLVTELGFVRDSKSLVYGFLEGFESFNQSAPRGISSNEGEDLADKKEKADFSGAEDTKLLTKLTGQYHEKFGYLPDHPKYGRLADDCMPADLFQAPRDLCEDKHLVFVRRIPSVRELTRRINEKYDSLLARKVYEAWGLTEQDPAVQKWRKQDWSRKGFEELLKAVKSGMEIPDEELDAEDDAESVDLAPDGDSYLGSRIADLFVVKKEKNDRTDCANVSLRFRKPESIFALFLEPASDYRRGNYTRFYKFSQSGKVRIEYVAAARDKRFEQHDLVMQKAEASVRKYLDGGDYRMPLGTVWTLVYPHLTPDQRKKLDHWATASPAIAENFAIYIKTGFLFASPVMVELYAWFTAYSRQSSETDAELKYLGFLKYVEERLASSLLLAYFSSALDSFETLCGKIIDHKAHEWQKGWRVLTSLQNPAWYASGESGDRQRLILGFNSPFYPNVMVATSVFQEGVNLHLQCNKVHHYGLAGSPGNNEQRVGRVDRLFGRVNRLLGVQDDAQLEIHYPFLKNSVDEDQVASFIARKFDIEDRMDSCTQATFDGVVELTRGEWGKFLRQPEKAMKVTDPYMARFAATDMPAALYVPYQSHRDRDLTDHMIALFRQFVDGNKDAIFVFKDQSERPGAILLVDPILEQDDGPRHQPVIVERGFSPEFSALVSGTVYHVSLKSPLASAEQLQGEQGEVFGRLSAIVTEMSVAYPLVRVAIDRNAARSNFYLHARVDLPVFARHGAAGMLSRDEVEMAYRQLKLCADSIEYRLFAGTQDLERAHLELDSALSSQLPDSKALGGASASGKLASHWRTAKTAQGDVANLAGKISLVAADKLLMAHGGGCEGRSGWYKAFMLNNAMPFASFQFAENAFDLSVDYPAVDFQDDERILLERWYGYIVEKK